MIVSSTRLRRTQLSRGRSTRPWNVIDGLRVSAVGQWQCRPVHGVVATARPSAGRLQSIPARPACAGGGHRATERVPTQSAACACGVGSSGRVDATGGVSGAGPAAAGAAADGNPLGWLADGRLVKRTLWEESPLPNGRRWFYTHTHTHTQSVYVSRFSV